ncbi:CvpA family protein [Methylophilus sp. VKM B-3414]|uniref:CvpA family protein n=1 Tax=Methylophilus sp. VKM B-3414 TaxID=3076121 RepID=UPI0028C7ED5F|nr:CvpA family protein [Methylophilus sp. VKM B-3414]MDT7850667.1 CvpA family protein [Methylophilus sp. VKM B-3414]
MTIFDYVVLGILGFSILVGLMRGAIHELFSVLGWVLAFYLANRFNSQVIAYMPEQIPGEAIKAMAAFLLVFLLVLFVCTLLALLLTTLIKAVGLGGLNRILGGAAGALKGLLIVCILVMLAAMTELPKDPRWSNAMFSAPIEVLVLKLLPWMPSSIAKHVHLDQQQLDESVI